MKVLKIFLFFLMMFSNSFAKQNDILNIRTSTNNGQEKIVIESNNKIIFNVFILNNPPRLVVDLQNTNQNIKAPNFKANDIIDSVRIGKYSETDARLVFDLNISSKLIKFYSIEPDKKNKNYRIIIDLKYDSEQLKNFDYIGKLIDDNINNLPDPNSTKNLDKLINGVLSDNSIKIKDLNKKNNINKESTIKYTKNYDIKRKPRIIIDAGHGGRDPGAIGRKGTKEKILTLVYARTLKKALDNTGLYKTYLTRDQDVYVDLRERVSISRKYKGDIFISIHADSSPNKDARGLSIYTLSQYASDTRTAELAKKENKSDILGGVNLYGEYQDTINTLVDISRSKSMNDSQRFSTALEKQMIKNGITFAGEAKKHGNFAVLISADMPSALIEVGFLSNKRDERMIRSYGYEKRVVNSIVDSINRYFGN